MKAKLLLMFCAGLLGVACESDEPGTSTAVPSRARFTVTIQNISVGDTLKPAAGPAQSVPISPGVWVVHRTGSPIFTAGTPAGTNGLEALAEDGVPDLLAGYLQGLRGPDTAGIFSIPVGLQGPGPLQPGEKYEITFEAEPGDHLSLAAMFVPSNDLFFATQPNGLALFDTTGQPTGGDVTGQIRLWDAGTEMNQAPGSGSEQAPVQSAPNTGTHDDDSRVRLVDDGFNYPQVNQVLRVTVSSLVLQTVQPGQPGTVGP